MNAAEQSEGGPLEPAWARAEARAGAGAWILRVLVAYTERAAAMLARSGKWQLAPAPHSERDGSLRYMGDASGGGSRTLEAARMRRLAR